MRKVKNAIIFVCKCSVRQVPALALLLLGYQTTTTDAASTVVNAYAFYCFRKKALYFKRGKKIQTAMKKQKLFCTLRWENFLSEKDGNRV